jgi:hypothetical protein
MTVALGWRLTTRCGVWSVIGILRAGDQGCKLCAAVPGVKILILQL